MGKIREFIRWMMVHPRSPELALAQYNELKTQIPALYGLLMVNAVAVSYTHFSLAPHYLTIGVLGLMLVATSVRLAVWIRARHTVLNAEQAVGKMRQTVVLAGVIAAVFIAWSLALDGYGGPAQRGHVALFIAITGIGCIFCLTHLPQAAMMVMAIFTVPYLIYYLGQGQDVFIAIALNIFLVCLVVLQVLLNAYRGFCELIKSKSVLAAKQAETERLNKENERLAHTDMLTNLPNRRYFFHRLDTLIEDRRPTGAPFAVGVIDLDRFKPINDTYGHQLGDELLAKVGGRLKALDCPDLEICRLGGDEFGFLYLGSPEEALTKGQKICATISDPYKVGDLQIAVGASCGVALFPEAGQRAHALFDSADYALYRSKAASRGRTTLFSAKHQAHVRSERALDEALQAADLDKEFQVFFQPIVNLPNRSIVGFEAVARWNSRVLDKICPEQFIPAAERTNVIHELSLTLFEKALRQIQTIPEQLSLTFNLSSQDLTREKTITGLLDIIDRLEATRALVTFEFTEAALTGSPDVSERCLNMLSGAGVKLAWDNFGTGNSSISHLHRLPVDCLKIDRRLVTRLNEASSGAMIAALISFCRSKRIACIAEGVEEQSQLDLLEPMQCRYAQGYFFAPALPFEDVLNSIRASGTVVGLPLSGADFSENLQVSA